MHHPFTFFSRYIPGIEHENLHIVSTFFIVLLLIASAIIIYPKWKDVSKNIIPEKKFNLRSVFELLVEMLASFCDDVIGPHGRKYLPFLGTLFIFLLFSNLLGLIPGFLPPTEAWATGATLAIFSFAAFNYFGFKEHGWSYIKHFVAPISLGGIKNPIAWILIFIPLFAFQILFVSIELVSTVLRPITLTIRLMANISADHLVVETFGMLVPYLVPIPFMLLGIFVSFVQAFIFTMLTMVYISMAVAHDH
ncbi:MAG: F0F1 ATP synthase subunit A [Bdellovibrionales bacterium]|nr:F0F1 ATP synthase subunit A [Bdellovibrionales bacterium]